MTDRESLVNLIARAKRAMWGKNGFSSQLAVNCYIADFLLANGAIVLPCKVGDTVWIKGDRFPAEIEYIEITEDDTYFNYVEYDRGYECTEVWDNGEFTIDDIGKTVFLTREEAEAALKEGK